MKTFDLATLSDIPSYLAPDGSEIRLLLSMKTGGLCHCTLPGGKISSPVLHPRVEEIWYILEGDGEVWRRTSTFEQTVRVKAGSSLTIPRRTAFQFRNTGAGPLRILIVTMPPWLGPQDAEKTFGLWDATVLLPSSKKSLRKCK